ncbi:MAG: CehA/McbA family metallohydrolase [Deltaproteobacteria bacterium]|nr:CehA/McbA family metallohydrolase [Deltaproteobacteria bacterium]
MSDLQRFRVCMALVACSHLASCEMPEVPQGEADAAIAPSTGMDAEVAGPVDAAVGVDASAASDGAVEGSAPDECGDGVDNDGNGATDCGDPACGGMPCRLSAGPCDPFEVCTGGACPVDVYESATFVCRPAAGGCDLEERCTEASPNCPEDAFLPEATSCRAPTGACDLEERCTGAAECPDDAVRGQGTVCRAAAGGCDAQEVCDGASADCPEDVFLPESTICRQSADMCDIAEICDGVSAECPADGVQPQGTSCRPAAGPCDAEETCSGTVRVCPPDGYESSTKACRPAADDCDAPEKCTGSSIDCPQDLLRASGFVCRAAAGSCDSIAERCSGTSASCPVDVNGCPSTQYCNGAQCVSKKARGVACALDGECVTGRCADGVCCDTACQGTCSACNLAGHVGTCSHHASGTDPENACGRYACNGAGACNTSCAGGCSSTQCDSSSYCAGTNCSAKKANGASCGAGCECSSGRCVDGVCCDRACSGPCAACNLSGYLGTCRNRTAGTDPENGCGRYACNGAGVCNTSCTGGCSSTQCDAANYCAGTSCIAKKAKGASCAAGCECNSGQCADGVCCDSACNGPCVACNLANYVGTCRNRTAGADPENGCGPYVCNGSGACQTSCTPSCRSGVCGALDGCGGLCGAASGCTLRFYFGSNHGHSVYSDGEGTPADHFALAANAGYDFYMISDHSQHKYPNFLPNWGETRRQANAATTPSFVAMWGFEFSENVSPLGHANVFRPYATYDADADGVTLLTFYDWLVAKQYIASFNHPGAIISGGVYDFGGFAGLTNARREYMAMIEVCKPRNSCFFDKVVEALDKGWRVAPVIGIDAHHLSGVVQDSRTAVLAPALTRQALLDAMKARHVYASKDSDLEVVYTVNGQIMGSVLQNPSQLSFEISVRNPNSSHDAERITRIEVLGRGGRVVSTRAFDDHSVYWKPSPLQKPFDTYYWLRIYSRAFDKNDNQVPNEDEGVAYSAPIWIE